MLFLLNPVSRGRGMSLRNRTADEFQTLMQPSATCSRREKRTRWKRTFRARWWMMLPYYSKLFLHARDNSPSMVYTFRLRDPAPDALFDNP